MATPDGVAPPDLQFDDTAVLDFPEADKIALAIDLERRTRAADPRIHSVRTTIYSDGWGEVALASTALCGPRVLRARIELLRDCIRVHNRVLYGTM